MKNAFIAALCGAILAVALAAPRAATGEPVSPACARMLDWIAAGEIRFRQSSASLLGSSHPVLERLLEFAYDCPDTRIRITGHTDAVGSPEYNQYLSEQRAEAVAAFLAGRGIPRERLVVRGAGADRPLADNNTAYGRERNRRIELELLPAD